MDEQSKARLDEILAKEVAALTDADKEFLRARRSYLTESQKIDYSEVLGEQPAEEKASTDEPAEGEAPKKAKPKKANVDSEAQL